VALSRTTEVSDVRQPWFNVGPLVLQFQAEGPAGQTVPGHISCTDAFSWCVGRSLQACQKFIASIKCVALGGFPADV
jgi:hypothetical protein